MLYRKLAELAFKKNIVLILDYSFIDVLLKNLWTYHYPVRKMKGENKALK